MQNKIILLVDDDADDRDLIRRSWRASGIWNEIVYAADGEQALNYLFGNVADRPADPIAATQLVVLDLNMPGMGGMECLRRIRADARTRELPVVILTGSTSEEDRSRAQELGATAYVRKPLYLQGVMVDITERKQAEAAVQESEERYRSLFANSLDAVLLTMPDGRILAANDSACRIFGRTEEELRQLGRGGVVDTSDPRLASALEERSRTGKFSGELTLVRKDGTKFPGELSTAIYTDQTGQKKTSMIIRDITERKRAEETLRGSEERFRSLFENMLDGFAYCQMLFEDNQPQDFVYLAVNRAFEELTGLKNVVGRQVTEVIPDIKKSNPELFEIYGRVALTGKPERFEVYLEPLGGMWLSISVYSQEKGYFIAVFDNITERKRAEEAIRRRAEQLAAINALGRALAETLDLSQVYERLYQAIKQLLPDSVTVFISLFDAERQVITCAYALHEGERLNAAELPPIPLESAGVGTQSEAIHTRQPLIVNDLNARLERVKTRVTVGTPGPTTQSGLYVPMLAKGQVIGVVQVQSTTLNRYSQADAELLSLVANTAAVAIQNARLFEETRARADQLALLYDAGLALNSVLESRVQLEFLFKIAMKALHADRAEFFRYDAARNELRFEQSIGYDEKGEAEQALRAQSFRNGQERGLVGWVSKNRVPLNVPDVSADPRYVAIDSKIRAGLWVPVEHENQLGGVLAVLSTRVNVFTPQDERLLALFANQVAVAMENARLFNETQQRLGELQILHQASQAVNADLDLDAVLNAVADHLIAALDAETCTISGWDAARNEIVTLIDRDPEPAAKVAPGTRLRVSDFPDLQTILEERRTRTYRRDDPTLDEAVCHMLDTFQWQSLLEVPLLSKERVVGVVELGEHRRPRDYGTHEIRLAESLSNQAAIAIENARLFEETSRRLKQIQTLHAIDVAISSSLDLRVTFNVFLEQVTTQLGIHAADVLLLDPHTHILEHASARGFRTKALQQTHLRLGDGYAGQAALERRTISISNLAEAENAFRRAPLFADEGFVVYYAVPLVAKGLVKGVLEIFHRAPLEHDQEWLDFLETLAGQAAIAIDNATLFNDLQRSNAKLTLAYDTTIEGWSHALDLRDKETEGHTQRVTEMTLRLARAMGMSEANLVHLRRGALLHDIGKMGVPDGILLKPGKLTDEEWVQMRKHPQFAYEMLQPIAYLRPALDIPYCHHEKWDGSGYPRGLKGEQIPLAARLFAVVDVWDALRSDRPYRAAWSKEQARQYIEEQAGKHFDPRVVEAFLRMVGSRVVG